MPSEKMCWMRSFGGAECVCEGVRDVCAQGETVGIVPRASSMPG